jgi:gamma-glutamyl phosphate reductase
MSPLKTTIHRAKAASLELAAVAGPVKNAALHRMVQELSGAAARIQSANRADLEAAAAEGLAAPLVKRLHFDSA